MLENQSKTKTKNSRGIDYLASYRCTGDNRTVLLTVFIQSSYCVLSFFRVLVFVCFVEPVWVFECVTKGSKRKPILDL